jgi:glycoside/pentoside/hexuronide:cation symporter, GPH family
VSNPPQNLPRGTLAQYGFLALPVAFAGLPIYILAPDFYATQYGLSLALLGVILLALRIFDAVQDPIIGWLSDRHSRHVMPIMIGSAILLSLGIYALFHPQGEDAALWFTISMLVTVTAYSVLSINLNALGALWSQDINQRTRITSTREMFGLLGLLIAVMLPETLKRYGEAGNVYTTYSSILLGLMLAGILLFARWLKQQPITRSMYRVTPHGIWGQLFALPVVTRRFFLVYGITVLASSIPAILVLFFIRDRLGAEAYSGLFLLLYFVSGAVFMPLWQRLSRRYGKYPAWLMGTLLAVASFVWAFVLETGDIWQYALVCIASGAALGADLALPPSILADHISRNESSDSAATQFSLLTLLTKAGLAVGSALALPMLDIAGFRPAQENDVLALFALSAAYALAPCLIKLLAAGLMYRFFIANPEESYHENISTIHSPRSRTHA